MRNLEKFAAIRRLWTAALVLAVQDVCAGGEEGKNAERWLTGPDSALAYRAAGLSQEAFCAGLERALRRKGQTLAVLAEKCPVDIQPAQRLAA